MDNTPIILFSSVFDEVLQNFCIISKTSREFLIQQGQLLIRIWSKPKLHNWIFKWNSLSRRMTNILSKNSKTKKICWRYVKRSCQIFESTGMARRTLILFGRTFVCKSGFLRIQYLKNKYTLNQIVRQQSGMWTTTDNIQQATQLHNLIVYLRNCKIKEVIKYNFVIHDWTNFPNLKNWLFLTFSKCR